MIEKKTDLATATFAEHVELHTEARRAVSAREAAAGMRGMRALLSVYERGGLPALETATVLAVAPDEQGRPRVLSAGADPSPILEPLSRGAEVEVEHEEIPLTSSPVLACATAPALEAGAPAKAAPREVRP